MNGMSMMMSALGINPEELKAQAAQVVLLLQQHVANQEAIKLQQDRIERKIDVLVGLKPQSVIINGE